MSDNIAKGYDPGTAAAAAAWAIASTVWRRTLPGRLAMLARALARAAAMRGPIPTHTPQSTEQLAPGWTVSGTHCDVPHVYYSQGEWTPGNWACTPGSANCNSPPGPTLANVPGTWGTVTGFSAGVPLFLGLCDFYPGTVWTRTSGSEPFGFVRRPGQPYRSFAPQEIEDIPFPDPDTVEPPAKPEEEGPEPQRAPPPPPDEPQRGPDTAPPLTPTRPNDFPERPYVPDFEPWSPGPDFDTWSPAPEPGPAPGPTPGPLPFNPWAPGPGWPSPAPSPGPLTPPVYVPGEDMPQEWPDLAPLPLAPPKPWSPVPVPYPAAPGLPSFSPEGDPIRGPVTSPGPSPSRPSATAPETDTKPWERPNERIVFSPDTGVTRSRRPHVTMPPAAGEKEIKPRGYWRLQVPLVRALGRATEYCDAVDSFFDALPDEVKAKYDFQALRKLKGKAFVKARKAFNERNEREKNPLMRSKWGRKATCQVKARAVYENLKHLNKPEAFKEAMKNLLKNEFQDQAIGRLGQGANELSRQTGRELGWGARLPAGF